MKKNQKVLNIGLVVIIFTAVICIIFTYYIKLREPVFLRYCMDVNIPNFTQGGIPYNYPILQLEYITDSSDIRTVSGISFPEATNLNFTATENSLDGTMIIYNTQPTLGTNYGRYNLRNVNVYLNYESWLKRENEIELHKAIVTFNDGKEIIVDIGIINLYSDVATQNKTLEEASGTSSSDGTASSVYHVKENINLLHIESSTLAAAKDLVSLTVADQSYKDLSNIYLKGYHSFTIESQFQLSDNNNYFDVYDIRPKLYYKKTDGSTEYCRILLYMPNRQLSSFKDLLFYLWGRGIF